MAAVPETEVIEVASMAAVVLPFKVIRSEAVAVVSVTLREKALLVSAIVERLAIVSSVIVAVITPEVFRSRAFASVTEMLESVTDTASLPSPDISAVGVL